MTSPVAVEPLITVVVPAYNAEKTIIETLRSIRDQTYARLEILVVDDGSHDRTAEVVSLQARDDPRIRLIRQPNGGVSVARNRGIEEAAGAYVAFTDADDLWRPAKIEKQLEAFVRGGPRAGLAYTQFVLIDEHSRIIGEHPTARPEGDVLRDICTRNIVGHGSGAMIRRDVFDAVGRFDEARRKGCEDHELYFRVAERYDFVAAQEVLVGYRLVAGGMTSAVDKMLDASRDLADQMLARHPEFATEITLGRNILKLWLFRLAVRSRRWRTALSLGVDVAFRAPMLVMREVVFRAVAKAFSRLGPQRATEAPRSFL